MEKIENSGQITRIHPTTEGQFCILCPNCAHLLIKNLMEFQGEYKLWNFECECGNNFKYSVEGRSHYRKQTRLPGEYFSKNNRNSGDILIKNLSMTGLRFSTLRDYDIQVGDRLKVCFRLDDKEENIVKKEVRVMNIEGNDVGCELIHKTDIGRALGFYLF